MDWLDLLSVQGILKSLLQHHSSKASILRLSAFFRSNSHIHRRRQRHPTPVLLLAKSHGQRSLEGCSSGGCKELDTTERLSVHARSHACINIQVQVYVWIYVFNSLGQQPRSQTAWPNGNYVLAMLCCRPTFSEYSGLPAALRSRRSLDSSSGSPRIGSWLHHSPAN